MNKMQEKIFNAIASYDQAMQLDEEKLIRVGGIVYGRVMDRALDVMSDEGRDNFEKLVETSDDPQELFSFLEENVPYFEDIITGETERYMKEKADLLEGVDELE